MDIEAVRVAQSDRTPSTRWWLAAIAPVFLFAPQTARSKTPAQIQYIYDAAGNLIQVTRSAVTPKPDLTVSNLAAGMVTVNANGSFNVPVTYQVNNAGSAAASATWYDRAYLSATDNLRRHLHAVCQNGWTRCGRWYRNQLRQQQEC